MKIINKSLNERALDAIISGRKKIEIRANKHEFSDNSFNNAVPGDIVIFEGVESKRKVKCIIRRICLYPDVRTLLEKEGTEKTLSSTDDIETGIRSIRKITGYAELIDKYGVFAIELEYVGDSK